jgi:hypothetical protein
MEARLNARKLSQQNEQFKSEQIAKQAELKVRQDQFDKEQALRQHQFDLTKTIANIDNMMKLTEASSKGQFNPNALPNPPGVENLAGDVSGFNLPTGDLNQSVNQNLVDIGGLSVPRGIFSSPEQMAQWKAKSIEATTPAVSAQAGAVKSAEAGAEYPFQTKLLEQKTIAEQTLKSQEAKDTYTRTIAAANIAAASRLGAANIAAGASRYAADKRASTTSKLSEENLQPILLRATSGQETIESLAKTVPQKERVHVINAANANGIQFLKDSQVKELNELQVLGDIYSLFDKYHEAIKKGNLGEINTMASEVDSRLGNIARQVGGEKGVLTEKDFGRAQSLRPDYFAVMKDPNANVRRLAEFKKFYIEKMNRAIPMGASDVQRKALSSQFGLLSDTTSAPAFKQISPGKWQDSSGQNYMETGPIDANGHRQIMKVQ